MLKEPVSPARRLVLRLWRERAGEVPPRGGRGLRQNVCLSGEKYSRVIVDTKYDNKSFGSLFFLFKGWTFLREPVSVQAAHGRLRGPGEGTKVFLGVSRF